MPEGGRCPACGEPAPASRFCPHCGQRLTAAEGETAARKIATLVFCDVAGSTALGEELDPEALRAVMGRYFAIARDAVERHGGTVEKFVGDAVLAVFGVPETREDDALRAVRAAAELRRELSALCAELHTTMGLSLAVRTGVNTGPVVTGAARAGGAFATGDAVNTAARLEQAAEPGQVLLGEATLRLVRDAVRVEAVEPLVVKGKAAPLAAYRLVDVLAVDRGVRPAPAERLIGRDGPAQLLRDAFARCVAQERCELVTVIGPAGIGKSALVEHVLTGLDATILVGRCLSYGTGITFRPIVQAVRQAAGLEDDDDAPDRLATLLGDDPDAALAIARLLPLLGLGGEPGAVPDTFWAVRRVLAAVLRQGPAVMVFEDVHWAEPLLLDLIDDLRAGLRDEPLLLVVAARPEFLDQRPAWGGGANALTFTLDPLSDADIVELVGDAAAGADVARWADGVPLFARELAAHLRDTGQPGGAVPPSLAGLLAARLDRLPAPERRVLERAAVLGAEFTAADLGGADVDTTLAALQRRELLRRIRGADRAAWTFRHVLVREAVYDAMPKAARAAAHEELAARPSGAGAEAAALTAHHLQQAARLRAELALPADDLTARALEATVRAMQLAGRADDLAAAAAFAGQAVRLCADPDRRAELALQQAMLAQLLQDPDGVRAALAQLPPDRPDLDRLTARALAVWADTFQIGTDVDGALAVATRLTDAARAAGRPDRLAAGLLLRLLCALHRSQFATVDEIGRELGELGGAQARRFSARQRGAAAVNGPLPVPAALERIDALRADPTLSTAHAASLDLLRGTLLAWDDQLDEATTLIEAATATARGISPVDYGSTGFARTFLALARADDAGGIAVLRTTVAALEQTGNLAFASTQLAALALLLLRDGQRAEAEDVLRRADRATGPDDVVSVAYVAMGRAVMAAQDGDGAAFARQRDAALRAAAGSDSTEMHGECRWWLADGARALGDSPGELALLDEARELLSAKGCRSYVRLIDARRSAVASVTEKAESGTPDQG